MVTQLACDAGAYVIGTGRAADRPTVLGFVAQEFVTSTKTHWKTSAASI
jgi:hypothetical protein